MRTSVVSITRDNVQPPTVIYRMLADNIGYVWVMAFGRATPTEFDAAITRLNQQGAKALVLDLRNDGGGYVDSALDISSKFIANKALLTVEERGRHDTTIHADATAAITLPVSVLVNQYTASASEITAGALQDDGIAMLVGAKTFGKGVMQTLTPLPDGAAIKITTAHYLTPNRRDINLRGIDPGHSNRREPERAVRRDRARRAAARRDLSTTEADRDEKLDAPVEGETPSTAVAADQSNDRSVTRERDVVHQAPHEEDAEPPAALIRLDAPVVARRRKAVAAVADLDRELVTVEPALDRESKRVRAGVPMLDGVAQRLARGESDIRNLAFGEAAGIGKACHPPSC